MTESAIAVGMLVVLILAIFLGFPVAFTLMALGVGFGYYAYYDPSRMWAAYDNLVANGGSFFSDVGAWFAGFFNNRIFDLLVNNTYNVMTNDTLAAIPLFLFMGYVVERANIVQRLFMTISILTRGVPGSMALAALLTCTMFATATGIVGAVVTLMGLLALPSMLKARYNPSFATGVIAAGGTLGILIPPSIMLIVYAANAATQGVSSVRLYAAALLPGLMLAGLYAAYIIIRAIINPSLAPKPTREEIGDTSFGRLMWMLLTSFLPLFALIMTVLGAILLGWAAPSQAAAFGALGALVLAIGYRALTWERLRESVYLTVRTSAMVCWLFVGSATFASIFSYLGGQSLIESFVQSLDLSPLWFLIIAQLIIFVLGWPLEWTEIIIIFIPIFLPLLPHFGIDPLLFAVLVAVNLQTAFLSPPMAMSAYYLKGIAPKEITLNMIFRGMMPYMFIVIICLILIYIFPQIALWLPNKIYN